MSRRLHLVLLVLVIILLGSNVYAEGDIKIGVDIAGKHKFTAFGVSGTEDVNTGISLSGEYIIAVNPNLGMGGGITFQIPRSQEDYSGDFNFIPFYGLIKIHSVSQEATPYIIGQMGGNLFMGDNDYKGTGTLSGGLYYGLGAGIVFNNNQVELLYSVNTGSYELSGYGYNKYSMDVEYSKITLSYGYVF